MDIRFSGVSKIFEPDIVALEDVYLDIESGEFVYLIGETGSGKTTLMRCIFREVVPTRGHISVRADISASAATRCARWGASSSRCTGAT